MAVMSEAFTSSGRPHEWSLDTYARGGIGGEISSHPIASANSCKVDSLCSRGLNSSLPAFTRLKSTPRGVSAIWSLIYFAVRAAGIVSASSGARHKMMRSASAQASIRSEDILCPGVSIKIQSKSLILSPSCNKEAFSGRNCPPNDAEPWSESRSRIPILLPLSANRCDKSNTVLDFPAHPLEFTNAIFTKWIIYTIYSIFTES